MAYDPSVYDSITVSESSDVEVLTALDSYAFANADYSYGVNATYLGAGQSFTSDYTAILKSVIFSLSKDAGLSGSLTARIYAHSGTYGSTSVPGALLATSNSIDASTLSSVAWEDIEFTFPEGEQITLESGTYYVVVLYYTGADSSNYAYYETDQTSPAHDGNYCYYDGGWTYYAAEDVVFYVMGEVVPDRNITVNDIVSLSENAVTAMGQGHAITAIDVISISESVSVFSGTPCIDINESISVSENVSAHPDKQINPYESVSTVESIITTIINPISTDAVNNPKAPVASLEAEMTQRLEVDGKFPTSSLTAYSGAIESATAPVASLDAEITYEEGATLDKKAPTSSLEAYSGAVLDKTSPTTELEAESYSNYIKLDSKAPVAVVEATCYYLGSMTLSKTAPFWTIEAKLRNDILYLDKTAPVWYVTEATGYTYEQGEVDNYAPVWKALFEDLTLFDPGIDADMTAPVGTMREDTGMFDTDKAEGSYSDQYEVTLEYSR